MKVKFLNLDFLLIRKIATYSIDNKLSEFKVGFYPSNTKNEQTHTFQYFRILRSVKDIFKCIYISIVYYSNPNHVFSCEISNHWNYLLKQVNKLALLHVEYQFQKL
jgi:hypothetical protein